MGLQCHRCEIFDLSLQPPFHLSLERQLRLPHFLWVYTKMHHNLSEWFPWGVNYLMVALISVTTTIGCDIFTSNIALHHAFHMYQQVVMHKVHNLLRVCRVLLGSSIRFIFHRSMVGEFKSVSQSARILNQMARVQMKPKVICSLVSSFPHIEQSGVMFGSPRRIRLCFTAKALDVSYHI